ncbi:hypothetical protein [Pontimicrobium sp. IMCC45349]|uniref:hypothetical protein n=1 Tax=Pontimicrobium sp. IMCC45349 TaxID=3391574 RepID=UPI0039A13223
MNTNIFPFQIGEQYEEHEFELQDFDVRLIGDYEYDIYEYKGLKINSLLGFNFSTNPLLYYNADILARVDYMFNYMYFDSLLKKINSCLPVTDKLQIDPFIKFNPAFYRVGDLALEILRNDSENVVLRVSHYHQFFI